MAEQATDQIEESLDLMEEERSFGSLDEVIAVEASENEGRWVKWAAVPGLEVKLAHGRASHDKFAELDRRYRLRHKKLRDKPVPAKDQRELYILAIFGTSVLDWKGVEIKGQKLEFNEANFRRAMQIERFRKFIVDSIDAIQEERDETEEDMGKG